MEVEKCKKISGSDATLASLIAFLLGATLAAIVLVGSDIPLKCFESGNAADWLAAVGTWVIGYGAWSYSRNTFIRTRKIESDRVCALLRTADYSARHLQAPHDDLVRIRANPSDPSLRMVRSMLIVADTYLDVVSEVSWTEAEHSLLNGAEASEALGNLEVCLRFFKTTVALFIDANSRDDTQPVTDSTTHLTTLIGSAKRLHTAASIFRMRVAELRRQAGDTVPADGS